MKQLQGIGASGGIAIGAVHIVKRMDAEFEKRSVSDTHAEVHRFESARALAATQFGADKQVLYLGLDAEENPALGYRALRICLDRDDITPTLNSS